MEIKAIGIIHNEYLDLDSIPGQGYTSEVESVIEIFEEYEPALLGIEKKDKLQVIYFGHEADRSVLISKNRGNTDYTGVFTSRSPVRPNPLAICNVKILSVDGRFIRVRGLDALNQSPVVDIKGYLEGIVK